VEAERNPQYLKAIARAVEDFRAALTELLALYVPTSEAGLRGLLPPVVPRGDADPEELARLKAKVARASGSATAAIPLTNTYIVVEGRRVDPIAAWLTITQPKPLLEPDDVLAACDSTLGRIDGLILKAEAEAPPTIGAAAMHPLVWSARAGSGTTPTSTTR
jgi:hypothetical protein